MLFDSGVEMELMSCEKNKTFIFKENLYIYKRLRLELTIRFKRINLLLIMLTFTTKTLTVLSLCFFAKY